MSIKDNGIWSVDFNDSSELGQIHSYPVFIESSDFEHDVRLYINGDFTSKKQVYEYAQDIAARLNRTVER